MSLLKYTEQQFKYVINIFNDHKNNIICSTLKKDLKIKIANLQLATKRVNLCSISLLS